MRKKYLSALLFGALLFASAGTFTSCKDYDDDIDGLRTEITDLKSAIEELQQKIGDGKFVTSVAANGQGLTITWNDGNSTTIENVINEATGETGEGSVVTFDEATGEILINGEGTGYYASKSEIGEYKAPYVNADGALVLVNEKGEEVVTNILTAPVTAVENADGSVTLTIRANGSTQSVVIPSAASMLSEVELVGYQELPSGITGAKENGFYTMHAGNIDARPYRVSSSDLMKDWKGNKPKLLKDDVTYAYDMHGLVARIAPSQVDAKELDFSLVNSKGEEAPVDVVLTDFTNDGQALTRANSTNSMYNVKFDCVVVNDPDGNSFTNDTYGTAGNPILFALKENSGLISKYDIAVKSVSTNFTINNVWLADAEGNTKDPQDYTTVQTNPNTIAIDAAKEYTVNIDDAPFVYDAYLEFTEDQAMYWQVEYNQAESPMTFSIKRMPDSQTPAPLQIAVHYAQMDGQTGVRYVYVTPQTNLNGVQLSEMIDHDIVAYNATDLSKNSVVVPLDAMVTALGNDGYVTWKADADLNATQTLSNGLISIVQSDDMQTLIADNYTVTFLDKDGKTTTDAAKAVSVRFTFHNSTAIDLDKDYVAIINFKSNKTDKYYNNVVNTVNFPVQFAIPAFTDLLQKDPGVFTDEKQEVASAYLLEAYDYVGSTTEATTTYKFNGAFLNLGANTGKGFEFKLELDNNNDNKIANNKTTAGVACLTTNAANANQDVQTSITIDANNANSAAISLRDSDKDDAYGKELIVKLTDATYCDVYKYDDITFKIKLLSPIKEGKVVADGGAIAITSTGTTTITAEDIWATTVNDNVKYDLFYTAVKNTSNGEWQSGWARLDLEKVVFSSDGIKFTVENPNGEPYAADVNKTTGAINRASSISLRGSGNPGDRSKLKVAVTDIWGYTLEDEVDVVVE